MKEEITKTIEEVHRARLVESPAGHGMANPGGDGTVQEEAEEWNKQKPPAEQCGMRVFILTTWQEKNSEVMVTKHDFNDKFGSRDAFSGHAKVEKEWQKYAVEQFGQSDGFDFEVSVVWPRKSKIEPVEMVLVNEKAWIVNIKDMKLACMKDVVQGFITFYYHKAFFLSIGPKLIYKIRKISKGKHQVPWNSISQNQSKFKFRESSKLQKDEVVKLLEFWRERQNEDKIDVFAFHQLWPTEPWRKGKKEARIAPLPSSSSIEPSSDDEGKEGDKDRWGPRDEFENPPMDNLSANQSTCGARSRLDFSKKRSYPEKPKTIHERLIDLKEAQVEGGWILLESRGPPMVMDMLDVQGKKLGPPWPQPRIKKKTSAADLKVNQDVSDRSGIKGIDPQPATPSRGSSKKQSPS
ncbi:hypothetical protein F5I97DRAFT_1832860 [Phlebopus sp. FC_14]|nr:hypothetical protein F5I97DRAFT_1832860 [Phlebopus sp. FC_14]